MGIQSTVTGTVLGRHFFPGKWEGNKNGYEYWLKAGEKENLSELISTVFSRKQNHLQV